MMNAVQPMRCLLELRADELEKTRNVCGQHGTTRLVVATQPAQVSRPPGDVCIKLNTSERIPTISAVVSGESNWRSRSRAPYFASMSAPLRRTAHIPPRLDCQFAEIVPCRCRVE